jgi:ubiquinone/menaquinone biosynthesis C-methylase UbiE
VRKQLEQKLGRRFARLVTNAVVRRPLLWRPFRRLMRMQFDRLAPRWDTMRDPAHLTSFERALERVDGSPRRVLDLGTGTGAAAFVLARRFPEAQVTGVDLSEEMLAEARRKTPPELAERARFEQADAARLPYGDASFELVTLANMIPFFDELARVLAPGGWALFSFSVGPETPIWVPPERLRSELSRRGFSDFADFQAGPGTALLARKLEHV